MTKTQINKALGQLDALHATTVEAGAALRTGCEELAEEIQGFIDEKTERWAEGETGGAYVELANELYNYECELEELPEFYL